MADYDQGDYDQHGSKGDKEGDKNFLQDQHKAKNRLPGMCHAHVGVNVCILVDIALQLLVRKGAFGVLEYVDRIAKSRILR